MSLNAVLGHRQQSAFLEVTDALDQVANLLVGARKTEWEAGSLAERVAAIQTVAAEMNSLAWRGEPLFEYQPFSLPTDEVCRTWSFSVNEDGETTSFTNDSLNEAEYRLVEGAVHLARDDYEDYGDAARITAYEQASSTFSLGEGFTDSLASRSVIVVSAVPLAIRRAVAIQAVEMLMCRDAHELAKQVLQGRTTTSGEPGSAQTLRNVGGQAVWHPEALWLVRPYLKKQIRAERE
ncbi:MAG: hypothetical protein P9L99_19830 [Candidatus Lernaella stagnicola]|nr:hypothetical protein [Candidatus Lernaella stagnicola]